jgi:7-carboxy-7-deazaguanine synthase
MGTLTTTAAADTLPVAECFGPTVQGEGPSAGRLASFIRLGGCNLHCGWCDTPYTWDASRFDLRAQVTRRPVGELAAEVLAHRTRLAVITGGEPLLHQHQPAWPRFLAALDAGRVVIEVETNGTQVPSPATAEFVGRFNVSPKLARAGDPASARLVPAAITELLATGRAAFKFVCADLADLGEVKLVAAQLGIPPHLTWIMPEGTTAELITARLRDLADAVVASGFNPTTRMHVLAWGDERGR